MSGELKHVDLGTGLTRDEWKLVTAHAFDSQATGDMAYASSATQLSRLAKGAAYRVLHMKSDGTIPEWTANLDAVILGATDPVTLQGLDLDNLVAGDLLKASAADTLARLAKGTARQLLQMNAGGTLPEWADNIDIPGTLDVAGIATFDTSVITTAARLARANHYETVEPDGAADSVAVLLYQGEATLTDEATEAVMTISIPNESIHAHLIVTYMVHSYPSGGGGGKTEGGRFSVTFGRRAGSNAAASAIGLHMTALQASYNAEAYTIAWAVGAVGGAVDAVNTFEITLNPDSNQNEDTRLVWFAELITGDGNNDAGGRCSLAENP